MPQPYPLSRRVPLWIIDGALLGLFMLAVGVFAGLLYSPASPMYPLVPGELARGALMGLAMGATAITLIYSPLGSRSGAHMNPAVTLAFLRLGRVRPLDATGYIACQFAGGLAGTLLGGTIMGTLFTDDPVRYAPTTPSDHGAAIA